MLDKKRFLVFLGAGAVLAGASFGSYTVYAQSNPASNLGAAVTAAQNTAGQISGAVSNVQGAVSNVQSNVQGAINGAVGDAQAAAQSALNDAAGAVTQQVNTTVNEVLADYGVDLGTVGAQLGVDLSSLGATQLTETLGLDANPLAGNQCSPNKEAGKVAVWYGSQKCSTSKSSDKWWGDDPEFAPAMQTYLLTDIYENRIIKDFWEQHYRPALQAMTASRTATLTATSGMMGKFQDALAQNKAMGTLQEMQAQIYKNYTPSDGLCRFGTTVRSLAASEQIALSNAQRMGALAQSRMLGTKNTPAATGYAEDRKSRLDLVKSVYCDPSSNDGKLAGLCGKGGIPTRYNKDLNYSRTVGNKYTLNLNYMDGAVTPDEQDVVMLGYNLYGHDVLSRFTDAMARDATGTEGVKDTYRKLRGLTAIRNVARSSYDHAASIRSAGATGSAGFVKNIMHEMGMSDTDIQTYIGASGAEPSYYAQMGVLTKYMYLNPNFYTNLMDKPVNVDRQLAAMQAIGLMQERDIAETMSRQELLISLLLEMKIRNEQNDVMRRQGQSGSAQGGR